LGDLVFRNDRRALGTDGDAHRLRDADRVSQLHFRALGDAGGDDVLRDVAGHVARAAVDLAWILTAERPTAVRAAAAVAVHDDLATGQSGIAMRPADDEPAGRVDVEDDVVVPIVRRDDGPDHLFDDLL